MIRRLVADGVPRRKVARQLGVGRATVDRAVASDRPPAVATSFAPFEARVRALLEQTPDMPATVLAERVDSPGSMTWFRDNVRLLRPDYRRVDPADRLVWEPGDAAQCDLWFPPRRIPLEDGSARLLQVTWTPSSLSVQVARVCRFSASGSGRQVAATSVGVR